MKANSELEKNIQQKEMSLSGSRETILRKYIEYLHFIIIGSSFSVIPFVWCFQCRDRI